MFKKSNAMKNSMEFELLTKTVGHMPSTATGQKHIAVNKSKQVKNKNKKSIGEGSTIKNGSGQSLSKVN